MQHAPSQRQALILDSQAGQGLQMQTYQEKLGGSAYAAAWRSSVAPDLYVL